MLVIKGFMYSRNTVYYYKQQHVLYVYCNVHFRSVEYCHISSSFT